MNMAWEICIKGVLLSQIGTKTKTMGTVDDELFQYFLSSVIPAPWNVHVRMIGNMSPGLLSKMASSWDAISEEARIGCLLTLIHSPKKPLALELQGEASQVGFSLVSLDRKIATIMDFVCSWYN